MANFQVLAHLQDSYLTPLAICFFILLIQSVQLVLRDSWIQENTRFLPNSTIFVILGILVGLITSAIFQEDIFHNSFDSHVIFDYLIPPIILDATYSLYCRDTILELDGIMLYAINGTLFNVVSIAGSLYGTSLLDDDLTNLNITFRECLVFSSIVSAVDPVAVIAVFEELNVQKSLTVLVFGESLFNDGVALAAFEGTTSLASSKEAVGVVDYVLVVVSLITVGLGGFLIGCVCGVVSALLTKISTKPSRIFEIAVIVITAYISYAAASSVSMSGILAIIGCGIVQKRYSFKNLHYSSSVTLKKAIKSFALTTESVIFTLFGIDVLNLKVWNTTFVLSSLAFVIIFRFVSTIGLGMLVNSYKTRYTIPWSHLIVISYGGLRGAVAFAMVKNIGGGLNEELKDLFVTATLVIILFTCCIQGSTVRWLMKLLHFNMDKQTTDEDEDDKNKLDADTMVTIVFKELNFWVMAGMDAIIGRHDQLFYCFEIMERLDVKYIEPILCKKNYQLHQDFFEGHHYMKEEVLLDVYNRHPRAFLKKVP